MPQPHDTIAAIATPPGSGGIAVVRISGPQARDLLSRLFLPSGSQADGFSFRPRHLHHGHILDGSGNRLDEVLAVFMPGPRSFSGEDCAEIHCHGGRGVTAALLEALFQAGARQALPGEFSRRAFLNGRLDLTQAEAVAEIIAAPTAQGARLALAKLDGQLAARIAAIREQLEAMRMQVILAVDFPDEDAELLSRQAFENSLALCRRDVDRLLAAFDRARLWREGAMAVLAGRVNVGKSSLLNALLGRERAIVSDRAGTTRDYIEESLNLGGLPLRLVDTAGLRRGGDLIEEEGIKRSQNLADEADILLFVTDAPETEHDEESAFLRRHWNKVEAGRVLLVLNKADALPANALADADGLAARSARHLLAAAAPKNLGRKQLNGLVAACPRFALSAKTGQGLDALAAGLRHSLAAAETSQDASDIAPNLRQSQLLRQADEELAALGPALAAGYPPDILAVHLEAAAARLDEVTGSADNQALLDRIFSAFCIGK